jgi:membrane-bound metal-dependent hydrolase YbcI (DUF457 family)
MPSPLAHLAAGYTIYRLSRRHEPQPSLGRVGPLPGLLAVTAAFSLLPDIDSAVGLLLRDFGRFHNNATHSLVAGVFFSLAFALLVWRRRGRFVYWFSVALVCYSLHVAMDAATIGRGVMALWPITEERFFMPVSFFYGLHWSQGWFSMRHLWTLSTELVFVAVLLFILHWRPGRLRTQP